MVESLPGERGDGRGRPGPPPHQGPGAWEREHGAGPGLLEAPGPGQGRGRPQGQHSDRVVVDLVAPGVTGAGLVMPRLPNQTVHTLHAGLQPLDGGAGEGVVLVAAAGPGVNRLVITLVQSVVTKMEFFRNAEDGAQRTGATDLRTGSHGSVVFTDVTVVSLGSAQITGWPLVPWPPPMVSGARWPQAGGQHSPLVSPLPRAVTGILTWAGLGPLPGLARLPVSSDSAQSFLAESDETSLCWGRRQRGCGLSTIRHVAFTPCWIQIVRRDHHTAPGRLRNQSGEGPGTWHTFLSASRLIMDN